MIMYAVPCPDHLLSQCFRTFPRVVTVVYMSAHGSVVSARLQVQGVPPQSMVGVWLLSLRP
jgi:hypothetical protein